MNNQDYINFYKSEERIITDVYKYNKAGRLVDINDIINPIMIDNRQQMSPTDDQKDTPHCGGYSAATLIESLQWKNSGKLIQLDSHQVYAEAKKIDGQINVNGTYLEASLNAVLNLCKNDIRFDFLKDAKVGTIYNNANIIESLKNLIHKYDFIQAGFKIDQGWYYCTNKDYKIKKYGSQLGGHAVNICGYDTEGFYILNQWGKNWGSKGYAIIPYNVFKDEFMYGAYLYNIKK